MSLSRTPFSRRDVARFGILGAGALALPGALRAATAPDPLQGMIFGPGPDGYCDDLRIGLGIPLWSKARNEWLMYYYGKDKTFDRAAPYGGGVIAMATSADGIAWTRRPGPGARGALLEPSKDPKDFDSLHLGVSDVIFHAGEYWMYYFGGDRTPAANAAGVMSLGFATLPGLAKSKDGLNWTKVRGSGPGGALFGPDDGGVFASWASVVHDGGLFHMHYTAGGGDYDVLHPRYAVSKDGLNWEKKGEVRFVDAPVEWDSRGIIARQIMRNPFPGPRFLMIYAGIDGNPARLKRRAIAAAVSDDCVNWAHLYREPIFTVEGSAGWDAGEVTAPHLVVLKDELRLYYLGGASQAEKTKYKRGVGLAIAPGRDLRGLRRYAAKA